MKDNDVLIAALRGVLTTCRAGMTRAELKAIVDDVCNHKAKTQKKGGRGKALNENYNKNHPELRKGEMFLTNVDEEGFRRIGWQTKRIGEIAYDSGGNILQGHFPVFIQKSGYNIDWGCL
jgi:hypothetical protein